MLQRTVRVGMGKEAMFMV